MIVRKPSREELDELRWIANLQFRGYGDVIVPDDIEIAYSPSTFKIRYLLLNNRIYMSMRASDYRFILHLPAGLTMNNTIPHPLLRVYVDSKYSVFIVKGGNVFSKHVVLADPEIKPGDEVLVVDYDTCRLIGVGKAVKPGYAIPIYSWGEAVRMRETIGE